MSIRFGTPISSTATSVAIAVLAGWAALAACTDTGVTVAQSPAPSVSSLQPTPPTPQPTPLVGPCPVTTPAPVPATEPWRAGLFGSNSAYGNGKLWVGGLPENGVLTPVAEEVGADGAVSRKFGWWRVVPGTLKITGRRLDAAVPPARGIASAGYGDQGFQSSGVTLPTPGCWEVTGSLETTSSVTTSLTFVVLVLSPSPRPTGSPR